MPVYFIYIYILSKEKKNERERKTAVTGNDLSLLLRKHDSFQRNSHLLLIFQDIVSVLIFFRYCFIEGFKVALLGSPGDYSVIISNSILYDSIFMQGTYNHVSLIQLERSLISGLEELKIYVKLIT